MNAISSLLEDAAVWAMRFQRRSGVLRTEPIFVVSALRAPVAIAGGIDA